MLKKTVSAFFAAAVVIVKILNVIGTLAGELA